MGSRLKFRCCLMSVVEGKVLRLNGRGLPTTVDSKEVPIPQKAEIFDLEK
jgi:hypothetical protein